MGYRSESIATTVGRLNSQYFLPAIQREFVWRPDQILQLFDSILRGYPISSFLFWELQPENRDKWEAYCFISQAKFGGTHNQVANTNGVLNLTLVLDGQQRLTSLLIGLKGLYEIKKKYQRWDNPDAWVKQHLYLDLLKDPSVSRGDDTDGSLYYGLAFMRSPPKPSEEHYWLEVGKILNYDSEDAFDKFRDDLSDSLPGTTTKRQMQVFRRNLDRLFRAAWKDEVIAYYTEKDQDYDRVLDIFVRANEGGTKLSKSDLLLSMVTANWDDINAREEIFGFVDRLNTQLTRRNDFDKDFIMKSCLVLCDLPVAYKVQNFNNQNLKLIRQKWASVKSAVERAVDLTNYFGIDRDTLTSANALIPVIYYLAQRPSLTLRGTSPFDVKNASRIRQWLTMALLNGVFGGSSDNILRDIREVLQKCPSVSMDFPTEEVNMAVRKSGRMAGFGSYALDEVLNRDYGGQMTFLALALLYDECGWGTMSYQQDHLFAQSLFKYDELSSAGKADWYLRRDKLPNLALLLAEENQSKSKQPIEEWLATRDESFRKRHLLPADPALYKFEKFAEFMDARATLIRSRLKVFFSDLEIPEEEGQSEST